MVAGYTPSVARLYDPEDGQLHFSNFAAPDDCVLLFWPRATPASSKRRLTASPRSSPPAPTANPWRAT